MIKAVIFDFDETLVKTVTSKIPAYVDMAKTKYNLDLTEAKIRAAYGKPYEVFLKELFGEVDTIPGIIENYKVYSQKYSNIPYEGSVEVLNRLLEKYLVGILTSGNPELVKFELIRFKYPLEKLFYFQSGKDTVAQKPDPKVFEPLIEKLSSLGILPNEAVYVGDDMRDYAASSGAGLQFIAMAEHTTKCEVFENKNIPFVTSFGELEDKIKNEYILLR